MALGLVPKVLDSVDVIPLFCKLGGVADPPMVKVAHVQCIVRLERLGVHHAIRLNLLFYDRQQGLCFGVFGMIAVFRPFHPVLKAQTRLFCQRHPCLACLCAPRQSSSHLPPLPLKAHSRAAWKQ